MEKQTRGDHLTKSSSHNSPDTYTKLSYSLAPVSGNEFEAGL